MATFTPQEWAALKHKRITEQDKLNLGISLNIWDAARSYRTTHGEPKRALRDVLKDDEFRHAWNTFRGGYRWTRSTETGWMVRGAKKRGGILSSFDEKMEAAKVLGWAPPQTAAIERLRNISP